MEELKADHREASRESGYWLPFECKPEQIMEIVSAAHIKMHQENLDKQWVLAGLRRNYMLAYRPDFSKGHLMPVLEEGWAEGMPQGTTRMCEDWYEHRYDWLDEKKKPIPADWSLSGYASDTTDLIEWDCTWRAQDCRAEGI